MVRSEPRLFDVAVACHPGMHRTENEDALCVGGLLSAGDLLQPAEIVVDGSRPFVAMVADGLGGHGGGALASSTVLGGLIRDDRVTGALPEIESALQEQSDRLVAGGRWGEQRPGAGTTIVGLRIDDDGATVFNVGDSGAYTLQNGRLVRLSTDDVPEGEREGLRSGIVTQCIGGAGGPLRSHVRHVALDVPRRFLLCSDGITGVLDPPDIELALGATDPVSVTRDLLEQALRRGAPDNVSILVVDAPARSGP